MRNFILGMIAGVVLFGAIGARASGDMEDIANALEHISTSLDGIASAISSK